MADAQSDKPKNNEPKEVEAGSVPNLDQVNDLNQRKLEEEDSQDDSSEEDTDKSDGKDKQVPKDSKGAASDDDKTDKSAADEPDKADEDGPEEPEPAPELDTEITKAGKGKVAIKNFEGKTYYFNNLDEVPEDFEPQNYKALMTGTKALMAKEEADAKTEADRQLDLRNKETKKRVDAMEKSWDDDIAELKLDQEGQDEVFAYMEDQMKKGRPVEDFALAYRAMSYDKTHDEQTKKENETKKKRGGMVQAGGTNPGSKPKVIEGPPRGVTLDDVHQRVLQGL